jgi:hypothetical protein
MNNDAFPSYSDVLLQTIVDWFRVGVVVALNQQQWMCSFRGALL